MKNHSESYISLRCSFLLFARNACTVHHIVERVVEHNWALFQEWYSDITSLIIRHQLSSDTLEMAGLERLLIHDREELPPWAQSEHRHDLMTLCAWHRHSTDMVQTNASPCIVRLLFPNHQCAVLIMLDTVASPCQVHHLSCIWPFNSFIQCSVSSLFSSSLHLTCEALSRLPSSLADFGTFSRNKTLCI